MFTHKSDHKGVVTTAHEKILFAAKTELNDSTHEQTVIWRQLFAGHVVGSQPMKMGEKSIEG